MWWKWLLLVVVVQVCLRRALSSAFDFRWRSAECVLHGTRVVGLPPLFLEGVEFPGFSGFPWRILTTVAAAVATIIVSLAPVRLRCRTEAYHRMPPLFPFAEIDLKHEVFKINDAFKIYLTRHGDRYVVSTTDCVR